MRALELAWMGGYRRLYPPKFKPIASTKAATYESRFLIHQLTPMDSLQTNMVLLQMLHTCFD